MTDTEAVPEPKASPPQTGVEPAGEDLPEDLVAVAPDILANSLGEYFGAWWKRIRNGESGALPILAGLILIIIIFQVQQPKFLSSLERSVPPSPPR